MGTQRENIVEFAQEREVVCQGQPNPCQGNPLNHDI